MKVNDPNLSALSAALDAASHASKSTEIDRTGTGARPDSTSKTGSSDDVHLSELVRTLRTLAADSPERQARIEQIARSYADGTYHVDAKATASKIIDDAHES